MHKASGFLLLKAKIFCEMRDMMVLTDYYLRLLRGSFLLVMMPIKEDVSITLFIIKILGLLYYIAVQ